MKGFKRYFKLGILFATLLVPVSIFVFLKYCGKNKYSVPIYYTMETEYADPDCARPGPNYHINCIPFQTFAGPCDSSILKGKLTIISLYDTSDLEVNQSNDSNIRRILSAIQSPDILQGLRILVKGSPVDQPSAFIPEDGKILTLTGSPGEVSQYVRCVLFLPDQKNQFRQWVLVDPQGRIRGYYKSNSFEEIDRLIVELKILLSDIIASDE